METITKNFGTISFTEEEIIHFPLGLPGLPNLKRFIVIAYEEMQPLKFLQSIDDPMFSFVLVNPLILDPQYSCELQPEDYQDIGLREDEAALLYIIITVPNDPARISGNFKAPIVINVRTMKAKQIILQEKIYSLHASIPEILNRNTLG